MSDLLRSTLTAAVAGMLPTVVHPQSTSRLPYGEWVTVLPPASARRMVGGTVVNAYTVYKDTHGRFLDAQHEVVARSPAELYDFLKRAPPVLWRSVMRADLVQATITISSAGVPARTVWPRALRVRQHDDAYRRTLRSTDAGDIFLVPNSREGEIRQLYTAAQVANMTRNGFTASPVSLRELDPAADFMYAA